MANLFMYVCFVVIQYEIPFGYDGTYYYIDLELHGKPARFMIDTGAPHSALSTKYFRDKDLKVASSFRIFGFHKYFYLEHATFVISKQKGTKHAFALYFVKQDLDELKEYTNLNKTKQYLGIIGIDYFSKYRVTMNFEMKTMNIKSFIYPPFLLFQGR